MSTAALQISRRSSSSATTLTVKLAFAGIHHRRRASTGASHHNDHKRNHVYLEPTKFIGSWEAPRNPKEAEAKLALLRRDYAKQVKEVRKQYIYEMELQRQEQIRKDEARREEIRLQREERAKAKAAEAEARAADRKAFEDEFRRTLLKERTEKLEYWRMTEKKVAEKKAGKKVLLRRQSGGWIGENDLEKRLLEAMVDTKNL